MWVEGQEAPSNRATLRRRAERLGDELCRDALAWARTIAVTVSRQDAVEEELFDEVLAYAISLTGLRLRGLETGERREFFRMVRERSAIVKAGVKWRRSRRGRRLAASPAARTGQVSEHHSLLCPARGSDGRVTKEMFEHFRAATGLSSDVLVGKDENLASLVFYIAVHAVLSADAPLSRANALAMLRACRQCRGHFEDMLTSRHQCPSNDLLSFEWGQRTE